ncbi:hypothetical protein NDU88_000399 [Pleurodeles waltl]|uniref:Uncharacterized protein n=1 Tax=Pleurodeles waltl TaxID=8319 RepID=A0AAV7KQK7_PLEWA|nr:hypothetical protein NDU88_000399 [Pleurodeles waltl]
MSKLPLDIHVKEEDDEWVVAEISDTRINTSSEIKWKAAVVNDEDVKRYIRGCLKGMDLYSSYEIEGSGRKYVVVMIDYYSKWPEARIVSDIRSRKMIDFYEEVWRREGYPEELVMGSVMAHFVKKPMSETVASLVLASQGPEEEVVWMLFYDAEAEVLATFMKEANVLHIFLPRASICLLSLSGDTDDEAE